MIKYAQLLVIGVALSFAPAICEAKQEHVIQGRTMGTTYQVKVVAGYFKSASGLKAKIDQRLEAIN